jgi:dATP pyrophosphohydrolase
VGPPVKSDSQIPIRSRAAAAVILAGRGEAARLLVLQRNKNTSRGLWSLVMGRLEKGESAVEAIRREIREETGIAVEALYTTGCVDTYFNAGANAIELMPIFAAPFASAPEVTLDHEHLAYRWLSFAEAVETLAYPGQREAMAHIKRDFADRAPPEFRLIRDD